MGMGAEVPQQQLEQVQQAVAAEAPAGEVLQRVADLLSTQILTLAGLCLIGAVCGIAVTGMVRKTVLPKHPPDAPSEYHRRRAMWWGIIAAVSGFVWAAVASGVYTALQISPNWLVILLVVTATAPVAGAATPFVYDLFRWLAVTAIPALGHAIVAGIRKYGAAAVGALLQAATRRWRRAEEPAARDRPPEDRGP